MNIAKVLAGEPTKPLKIAIPDWMSGSAVGAPSQATANAQAAMSDDLIFDDNQNDYGVNALTAGMVAANPNLVIIDYTIGIRMIPTNANAQTGKYLLSSYGNGGAIAISALTGNGTTATVTLAAGHGVTPDPASPYDASIAITIAGSDVAGFNGTWLVQTVPAGGTSFTFLNATNATAHATGTCTAYAIIGGSNNPIADSRQNEYRQAVLNGYSPGSGSQQAGIGVNRHLFSYADYQGVLLDTAGRSPVDGAYALPTPIDPSTGLGIPMDRYTAQNNDAMHYVATHLARVDPGASFATLVSPTTPDSNPAGSNRGMNAVTGARFPVFCNALGRGDQYWGVDQYATVAVTSSTVAGTKITFVTGSAHGFGVDDWVIGLKLNSGAYSTSDGLYRVISVASATQFTVETFTSGLSTLAGGTVQRAAANRLTLRVTHGSMMESTLRFSTNPLTNWPPVAIWTQTVNAMIDCQLQGCIFWWCSKVWTNHNHQAGNQDGTNDGDSTAGTGGSGGVEDPKVDQWHKLCLASYLLGSNGRAYFHFRHDYDSGFAQTGTERIGDQALAHPAVHRYYTAVRTKLGTPVDTWSGQPSPDGLNAGITAAAVSGVYKRQFTKGIALVNPSGGALNFALPGGLGTLKNLDTRDATNYSGTISVPANTGLILTQ